MALPDNVTYGKITGRFLLAVGDTADPDTYPDSQPAQGQIKFTPNAPYVLDPTSTPDPVWIVPQAIQCTLDVDGYIIDPQGAKGVFLVATDDSDIIPTGWTYKVSFALTGGINITPFSISVPGGVTTDLTMAVPLPATPGTTVVTTVATADRAEAAAEAAEAALAAMPNILFNPSGSTASEPDGTLVARY